jgi:hypothetical protein
MPVNIEATLVRLESKYDKEIAEDCRKKIGKRKVLTADELVNIIANVLDKKQQKPRSPLSEENRAIGRNTSHIHGKFDPKKRRN